MHQSRAYPDLVEAMSEEETETSQVSNPEDDRKWSESTQHFRPIFPCLGSGPVQPRIRVGCGVLLTTSFLDSSSSTEETVPLLWG